MTPASVSKKQQVNARVAVAHVGIVEAGSTQRHPELAAAAHIDRIAGLVLHWPCIPNSDRRLDRRYSADDPRHPCNGRTADHIDMVAGPARRGQ